MKQGKKYSCEKALREFAMGFVSNIAARYVSKFGAKTVAKGMEKMGVNPTKIKKLTGVDPSDSSVDVSSWNNGSFDSVQDSYCIIHPPFLHTNLINGKKEAIL